MAVRGSVTAAATIVAFAAGFAASRGCAPTADSDAASAPPPATAIVRADPAATPERRRPRRESPPHEAARADATEAEHSGTSAAAEDDADFPFADVDVAWPNGDPAENAVVYALPAGRTCPDDETPPRVDADPKGHARLHVLDAGSYDVGALLGTFQTLATNVGFPRATPLRLVLPEPCTVTVHIPEHGGPEKDHESERRFRLQLRIDADDAREFPGRGEITQGWAEGWIRNGPTDWQTLAPRGARCRITHDASFRASPEVFTAPAEVGITPAPRYLARVRVELRSPERRFDRDTSVRIAFDLREQPAWRVTKLMVLEAGSTVGAAGTHTGFEFDAEFDGPSGTLTWQGAGLVAGSTPFRDLAETAQTPIDARVELDPKQNFAPLPSDGPPPAAQPTTGVSIRVSNIDLAGVRGVACNALDKDGAQYGVTLEPDGTGRLTGDGVKWLAAWRGSIVSEWVDVGTSPAAETHLELAQGGFLVVVPANLPPQSLGTPRLEREDGRPFPLNEGDDCGTSWDMEAGLVIGPLRPGTVTFRVTLAGRVLATATAEVRAGTYETLRIPRLRTQ